MNTLIDSNNAPLFSTLGDIWSANPGDDGQLTLSADSKDAWLTRELAERRNIRANPYESVGSNAEKENAVNAADIGCWVNGFRDTFAVVVECSTPQDSVIYEGC